MSHFVVTLGVGLVNFVSSLGISDDVAHTAQGIAIGPLIAAPLSELYGRQPVYIGSTIAFVGKASNKVFVHSTHCRC